MRRSPAWLGAISLLSAPAAAQAPSTDQLHRAYLHLMHCYAANIAMMMTEPRDGSAQANWEIDSRNAVRASDAAYKLGQRLGVSESELARDDTVFKDIESKTMAKDRLYLAEVRSDCERLGFSR